MSDIIAPCKYCSNNITDVDQTAVLITDDRKKCSYLYCSAWCAEQEKARRKGSM